MQTHFKKVKLFFWVVVIVGILVGFIIAAVRLPSFYQNSKSKVPSSQNRDDEKEVVSYRGSLTGTYECLPHKAGGDVQTLECAFGIKTDKGDHYALDFNLMSQSRPDLKVGERFSANGLVTPIEMLSSEYLRNTYDVKGVFSVTDSLRKI